MPYMLVRHGIKGYAQWRPVFEKHADQRKSPNCARLHELKRME